jgi:hypothetical protein
MIDTISSSDHVELFVELHGTVLVTSLRGVVLRHGTSSGRYKGDDDVESWAGRGCAEKMASRERYPVIRIRWGRSEEGYVESKCGRFTISPLYWGHTRPQSYELRDTKTGRVNMYLDTQADAKDTAGGWVRQGQW